MGWLVMPAGGGGGLGLNPSTAEPEGQRGGLRPEALASAVAVVKAASPVPRARAERAARRLLPSPG